MKNYFLPLLLFALISINCSGILEPEKSPDKDSPDFSKINPGPSSTSVWIDFPGNPVFRNFQNPSLPHDVRYSEIMYDDGKYKMWYTAIYNNGIGNIWYAESPDGISWVNVGNTPVLDKGIPGSWDSYGVFVTSVIKVSNMYMMYYIGQHDYYLSSDWSIGVAFSSDGINWQKHPVPALHSTIKYYYIGSNDVLKVGNLYYMFFEYFKPSDLTFKIGLAKSLDGIVWEFCSNPILTANLSWENGAVAAPSVIYEGGKFYMVYSDRLQTAFGMAQSIDGHNFTKSPEPIFMNSNTVNNWIRIAYPNYRKLNNDYRIYYSGEGSSNATSINMIFQTGVPTLKMTRIK